MKKLVALALMLSLCWMTIGCTQPGADTQPADESTGAPDTQPADDPGAGADPPADPAAGGGEEAPAPEGGEG
jgi:hypothetical protein